MSGDKTGFRPTGSTAGDSAGDDRAALETASIRNNIAQTRADMSGTIEELHGRLNPALLKEQALDQFHEAKEAIKKDLRAELDDVKHMVKQELHDAKTEFREATIGKVENMVHSAQDTITETSHTFVDTIKQNPIPAALAGIGLAWLFMNARSTRKTGNRRALSANDFRYGGMDVYGGDPTRGTVENAVHKVGEKATQHAQESLTHLAHDAQASIGSLAHRTGEGAMDLAHQAQFQAHQLEDRFERTLRENPLAVGAVALAIGTAVGLAIPSTRAEDKLMGEARDEIFGKAEKLAQGALKNVEEAAKHVVEDGFANKAKNGSTERDTRAHG